MRPTYTLAPLLVSTAAALPEVFITKRDGNLQASNVARGMVKRDAGTLETNLFEILTWSQGGAYYANVTVGTPPQNQVVILDTGSSDLYFDASTAHSCEVTGPYSCRGGTFNPEKSSSYKVAVPAPAFNTSFGDGSTAEGPFGRDIFGIGDVVIENVQFGVASEVNSTTGYALGLMGIGYSLNEATDVKYPNIPEVLADAGVINSRLYSIFLNSAGETSGSILFGGIDTSKYTGELVTVDILPTPQTDLVFEFITTVTGLSANVNGEQHTVFEGGKHDSTAFEDDNQALPVLLDTGSAAWTVPQSFYDDSIAPAFSYVDKQGFCSCKYRNNDDFIQVEFAGQIQIKVPASEFIVPVYNASTNQVLPYGDGTDACAFMIAGGSDGGAGFRTLGDSILRSMYVVFDLDQGQVSIAQAAVNSTAEPNVVTIGSGPSAIASAISSSYSGAPSNTWSIAGSVTASAPFSVSTVASAIGTATGVAAVPADARPGSSGDSSPEGGANAGGSPTSGSGGSDASSSGAAAGLVIPGADWSGMWVSLVAVCMSTIGASIML